MLWDWYNRNIPAVQCKVCRNKRIKPSFMEHAAISWKPPWFGHENWSYHWDSFSYLRGRNAYEIRMMNQEDVGLNPDVAKLPFAKGIWRYITKMNKALRKYSVINNL